LRDETEFKVDEEIYDSGIDLSKPIPATWSYGGVAKNPLAPITFVALVVAVARALWALGLDQVLGKVAERSQAVRSARPRSRWLSRRYPGPWAAGISAALLSVSLSAVFGASPSAWLIAAGVAVALVAGYTLLEAAAAKSIESPAAPTMLVGVLTSAAGFGFLPLAGVPDREEKSFMSRWRGPIMLAAVTALAFALANYTGVRFARGIGIGALAVLASALMPIDPLPGRRVGNRFANLLVSLALGLTAIALLFRWI
jgi:hypothetical protein